MHQEHELGTVLSNTQKCDVHESGSRQVLHHDLHIGPDSTYVLRRFSGNDAVLLPVAIIIIIIFKPHTCSPVHVDCKGTGLELLLRVFVPGMALLLTTLCTRALELCTC